MGKLDLAVLENDREMFHFVPKRELGGYRERERERERETDRQREVTLRNTRWREREKEKETSKATEMLNFVTLRRRQTDRQTDRQTTA